MVAHPTTKVGLAEGFEGTMAQVDHTGRVYWSRPGILSAYCKFSGILNFPFDNLKCKVEIGGWMLSGAHQGLSSVSATLDGTVGDNGESTSKPSYADYNLTHASAHIDVYEYPTDPQNPYPVMMINLELKRVNSTSWFWIVVMPMAALTYLAMFAAFIPIESGERLGYGITMLVAVEVNKMVLVGVVPIAGEILQLEILTFFSALFCYLALLQSFVIMFLYRHGKKHLMPKWMTDLRDWCTELCCNKEATADGPDGARSEWDILKQNRVDDGEMDDWDESGAAILYRAFQHYAMRSEQQLPTSEELDDLWDLHFQTEASGQPRRKMFATDRKMFATGRILSRSLSLNLGLSASLNSGLSPPPSPPAGDAEASEDLKGRLPPIHIDPAVVRVKTTPAGAPRSAVELEPGATEAASIKTSSRRRKLVKAGDTLDEESIKRLMLFEKLFFDLDTKVNGCVEQADLTRLLSYLCLDWSYKERKEFADSGVVDDDDDNKISRAEFLEVCLEKLWDYDTGILEMAITNFKTAQALVKQAPNRYWRRVVSKVDRISQFWMPLVYTVIIVVCYHLTLHDGYDQDIAMWNGMNYFKVTMTPQQVITILVVPLIGLSIWCFYFRVKKRALKQMKRKLDKQLLSAQEQVQLTISRAESSFERGSKEEYAAKFTRKSIFKKGTRTPKASENKIMAKNWLGRTLSQTSSSAYPPAV